MPDPLNRLQLVRDQIDATFGRGYSRDHPELVASVMLSASMDFAGLTIAHAIRDVANALILDAAEEATDGALYRPPTLVR